MSANAPDYGASVRARLLTQARQNNQDYNNLLQRYAAERFLYRLGVSPHRQNYVLKGAMLFGLWGGSEYRATKDLDFTGYGASDVDALTRDIRDICDVTCVEDGVLFDTSTLRISPIREEVMHGGVRITFLAQIGGARVSMQLDVGFADVIHPAATDSVYPPLLTSLPAASIRAYPREAVVAEKFHAMVVLGEQNTRFKDFYDVYVLASRFAFDGLHVAGALAATFERRDTPITDVIPGVLTARFYDDDVRTARWLAYVTRSKLPLAPTGFADVGILIRAFVAPIFTALSQARIPPGTWLRNGGWGKGGADDCERGKH